MVSIPGFNTAITEATLIASATLHNGYPPDSPFPEVDELSAGFQELCAIVAKHHVENSVRLRLLHRHFEVSKGQILLGSSLSKPLGWWTRPLDVVDIDIRSIYGHIFSINTTGHASGSEGDFFMLPSEFREGLPVSTEAISNDFLQEFTKSLISNGLEKILGIEILDGRADKMIEYSFDTGSMLLHEQEVKQEVREHSLFWNTGWRVTVADDAVNQVGEVRCVKIPNSTLHGRYPVPDQTHRRKDPSDALKILNDKGILAS